MTRRLFGTDGIRGAANQDPMTAEIALRVAMSAAAELKRGDHLHRVVIGKDTRLSGYMLEYAMTSGFLAMGHDVMLVGPLPTPAVAMLTRSLRADVGVMISASHNLYYDNGIKLFGPDGFKLNDQVEQAIERRVLEDVPPLIRAAPNRIGRAKRIEDAAGRYIEQCKASIRRGLTFEGLKVVIDSAHGAAYRVAPRVLFELGAEVIEIGNQPNGLNINEGCGATAPQSLAAAVVAHGAQLGIALDGDADRVILVDEAGRIVDGDQLLALIAESWLAEGHLQGGAVCATVMSNLGLERFLAGCGVRLLRTAVGDRHVVEAMRKSGLNVGGEQSGHIVLTDHATTGDGLIAALQVLQVMKTRDKSLGQLGHLFEPMPQVLLNVHYQGTSPLGSPRVVAAKEAAEARLNGHGRLLLRPSGTEPVIRVMVEGEDAGMIQDVAESLAGEIRDVAAGATTATAAA